MKNVITLCLLFLTVISQRTFSNELHAVVTLSGYWQFSIGDNMAWAAKDFDDRDWDKIAVPATWEDQGYMGYDGYAWYRTKIKIPSSKDNKSLFIKIGNIDDVNEVYFNGVKIGQLGKFPPSFETAYNTSLVYPIPEELLRFNDENTIAVRVYDNFNVGGIVNGPAFIGYDQNVRLLNYNLAGTWKFSIENYKNCRNTDYDDSFWTDIRVPATWESQGFSDYDGYAIYRKTFNVPDELYTKPLYLVLGKIDDKDKVYLNGKLIGSYQDMYDTPLGKTYQGNWQIRRAYKIPENLLNKNGKNTIVVLVYDEGLMGGIHEGPIGLMTQENYNVYVEENKESKSYYNQWSFFEFMYDVLFN